MRDVDGAGRLEDGHRDPEHGAVTRYDREGAPLFLQPDVRTVKMGEEEVSDPRLQPQ